MPSKAAMQPEKNRNGFGIRQDIRRVESKDWPSFLLGKPHGITAYPTKEDSSTIWLYCLGGGRDGKEF